LVAIFAAIDAEVPQNLTELYIAQIAAMVAFAVIAGVTGLFYTGRVDVYRIVRNGLNGGVAFPRRCSLSSTRSRLAPAPCLAKSSSGDT